MDKLDTSEYKVTYLLGAGASAQALPTVKANPNNVGFANALRDFSISLNNNSNIEPANSNFRNKLREDLIWLASGCDKFGTPDTFAKYLYLKDRDSLNKLKKVLSFYFVAEQVINKKIDSRPLPFLTSILQYGDIFPKNIKILTWNYDFQIQLAAEEFRQESFGSCHGKYSHVPPVINYYPKIGNPALEHHEVFDNDISMVHLNGIAGFHNDMRDNKFLNQFINKFQNINDLISDVKTYGDNRLDLLTYAWETDTACAEHLKEKIDKAKTIATGTNILVIIGYSFPFFNRLIDKQIFETLKQGDNLKKIYYQDPNKSGEFLRNQFDIDNYIEIAHIKDTDSYFIPNEL